MKITARMATIMFVYTLNIPAFAQNHETNNSFVSGMIGFNWYSPPSGTRFKDYPSNFKSFSGLCVSIRTLLKTPGIWSRVSLGAEYGIHALAAEKSGLFYYVDTGEPTTISLDAYYFHFVADTKLFTTPAMELHAMLGSGIVDDDETNVLRASWGGRLIGVFPFAWDENQNVGGAFELELSTIHSIGSMRLGTIGILGGASFRW